MKNDRGLLAAFRGELQKRTAPHTKSTIFALGNKWKGKYGNYRQVQTKLTLK